MHSGSYRYYCRFTRLEFISLPQTADDLPLQYRRQNSNLNIVYLLENYIGNNDWQCRYALGACFYVCRTNQDRKTRALWEISRYYRICNVTNEIT